MLHPDNGSSVLPQFSYLLRCLEKHVFYEVWDTYGFIQFPCVMCPPIGLLGCGIGISASLQGSGYIEKGIPEVVSIRTYSDPAG